MSNLFYKSRKPRKIDKETGNTNFNKPSVTENDRWWSIQIFNRGTGNRDRKFNFVAVSWLERDRGRHSLLSPRGIRSKVSFKGCCSCSSYFFSSFFIFYTCMNHQGCFSDDDFFVADAFYAFKRVHWTKIEIIVAGLWFYIIRWYRQPVSNFKSKIVRELVIIVCTSKPNRLKISSLIRCTFLFVNSC